MKTRTTQHTKMLSARFTALFLMLVSLSMFGSFATTVPAGAKELKLGDFTYTLDGGANTLTIDLYVGDTLPSDSALYIPSTYTILGEVYTVTAIGYAVNYGDKTKQGFRNLNDADALEAGITDSLTANLTSIILPNTLEVIGCFAFYLCSMMDSVMVPASVTTISVRGLSDCITKVGFEDGTQLDSIGDNAFRPMTLTLPTNRPGYTVEWYKEGTLLVDLETSTTRATHTAVWTADIPTSIEERSHSNEALVISPNPVEQSFTLNVEALSSRIYNLSGKCVKQFPAGTTQFDISSLDRGMYFIKVVEANGDTSTKQLMKK